MLKLLLKGSALAGAPVTVLGSCMQMARLSVYVNCIVPSARHHTSSGQNLNLTSFAGVQAVKSAPSSAGDSHLLISVLMAIAETPPSLKVHSTEAQIYMADAIAQRSLLQGSQRLVTVSLAKVRPDQVGLREACQSDEGNSRRVSCLSTKGSFTVAPPWSMFSVTLFCSVEPAAKKTPIPDCGPFRAQRLQSSLR